MSDTPRTDAQHAKWRINDDPYTDMTEFARELERELSDVRNLATMVINGDREANKLDAARWRMAMHYMTAHNRSIVEGLIPDKLPAPITVSVDYTSPTAPSDPYAAPQGQEVCQHARLPNDRVPEPAVAAPIQSGEQIIDECLNTLAARKIHDADRYKALKRQTLASVDSADDYGHIAETFDKECDELIEYFRKFDAGTLEICPNCDTALPRGCGGQFKQDGEACWWNRGK